MLVKSKNYALQPRAFTAAGYCDVLGAEVLAGVLVGSMLDGGLLVGGALDIYVLVGELLADVLVGSMLVGGLLAGGAVDDHVPFSAALDAGPVSPVDPVSYALRAARE